MLLYNHKKEFIGIDTHDLEALGYTDLNSLLQECSDIAQLFVKTPGFIHDFKHVHWIDFITCAHSHDDTKAIIHANGKSFRAILQIEKLYLVADNNQLGYEVKLHNLRELTKDEQQALSDDILQRSIATPAVTQSVESEPLKHNTDLPKQEPQITQASSPQLPEESFDEAENFLPEEARETNLQTLQEDPYDDLFDKELDTPIEENKESFEDQAPINLDLEDLDEETLEEPTPVEPIDIATPVKQTEQKAATEDTSYQNDYVYDPHVASEELGLPIDLIEEFIQDFINQAYEFKEELYRSLENGEIDNVRILSHKLKGVAANLRIEDAFDVLVIVNTSDDVNSVALNLDRFYKIIAKLAGKESPHEVLSQTQRDSQEEDSEDLSLEFKEEDPQEEIELEFKEEDPQEEIELEFKEEDPQEEIELEIKEEEPSFYEEDIFDIDDSELSENIEITEPSDEHFIEEPSTQIFSYDKNTVAGELGLDRESFDFLFNDFIQDANELMLELEAAIQNSDLAQVKKIAMKIKGMSDNMRISDLKNELQELITSSEFAMLKSSTEALKSKINALAEVKD